MHSYDNELKLEAISYMMLVFDPGDKHPAELFPARSENTSCGYNRSLFPEMKLDKVIKNILSYFTLISQNHFYNILMSPINK